MQKVDLDPERRAVLGVLKNPGWTATDMVEAIRAAVGDPQRKVDAVIALCDESDARGGPYRQILHTSQVRAALEDR